MSPTITRTELEQFNQRARQLQTRGIFPRVAGIATVKDLFVHVSQLVNEAHDAHVINKQSLIKRNWWTDQPEYQSRQTNEGNVVWVTHNKLERDYRVLFAYAVRHVRENIKDILRGQNSPPGQWQRAVMEPDELAA